MEANTRIRLAQETECGKRPLKCLDSHFSFTSSYSSLGKPLSSATTISDVELASRESGKDPEICFEDIVPEIIVRTDGMEIVDEGTPGSSTPAQESVRYVVRRS